MKLAPLIFDLSLILAAAAAASFLFHRLGIPVILGYIAAGIAVSPHSPLLGSFTDGIFDLPNIRVWGELGIVFLMFTLGLEFSFRRLAAVGPRALFTGSFEVLGLALLGYALGRWLGWSHVQSLFLGSIVSISSTTILVKSLENLKLKHRRFAEQAYGILIVEDLLAILMLVGLASLASRGDFSGTDVILLGAKLLIVIGTWMLVGFFLVPRFLGFASRLQSDELMTILAIALCLGLVAIAAQFDYSPALGAFIMGSIIGETRESKRIENLIRPLRDLFVAVFFVSIGMLFQIEAAQQNWRLILALAGIVVFGKFILISVGSLLTGQNTRVSTQTAMAMGQIGEFSFLLVALAISLKVFPEEFSAAIVAVSLLTALTTPFILQRNDQLAEKFSSLLPTRLSQFIEHYSLWIHANAGNLRQGWSEWRRSLAVWSANAILIIAVFALAQDHLMPWMSNRFDNRTAANGYSWAVTLFITAPLIWGLFAAFRRRERQDDLAKVLLFVSRVFAVVLLLTLSTRFMSIWAAIAISIVVIGMIVFRFFNRLESSYRWLETEFLSGLRSSNDADLQKSHAMQRLAPWDAHLVQIVAGAHSELTGRTLLEAKLRERFGLNVVAIQRGPRVIAPPARDERIFPGDELLVLATDEQIEQARKVIEGQTHPPHAHHQDLSEFDLRTITIRSDSPICGRSILSSQLREKHGVLVVGVERQGRRIMNPESQLVLSEGDVLWVVSARSQRITI